MRQGGRFCMLPELQFETDHWDVIDFSLVITMMRRELGQRWSPKQFQGEIQFPFRVTKKTSRSHMPSKPSKLPIGLWVGALRYLKSI